MHTALQPPHVAVLGFGLLSFASLCCQLFSLYLNRPLDLESIIFSLNTGLDSTLLLTALLVALNPPETPLSGGANPFFYHRLRCEPFHTLSLPFT